MLSRETRKQLAQGVKYHYFKFKNGGVTTLAMTSCKGVEEHYCGVAFCSPRDTFVKSKGRLLAFRRMMANMLDGAYVIEPLDHPRYIRAQSVLADVVNLAIDSVSVCESIDDVPQWAQKYSFEPLKKPKQKQSTLSAVNFSEVDLQDSDRRSW